MNNLPIEWLENRVKIVDQTRLPHEEAYLELTGYQAIASAIMKLKIRGAPAPVCLPWSPLAEPIKNYYLMEFDFLSYLQKQWRIYITSANN